MNKAELNRDVDMMLRKENILLTILRDDRGSTAIEYALIAALIAVAIITSVITLRDNLIDAYYNKVANNLS